MKLLCDTSVLLRRAAGLSSKEALQYLDDDSYDLYYSVAGVWEVAIKNHAGKLGLDSLSYEDMLKSAGFKHIDITSKHIQQLNSLDGHHKDPFDRIMIAQAIVESCLFLTTDKLLGEYHPNVIVVP